MKYNKIVITTDGKETLARLYDGNNVIESATAKCSPDDEFDFNIGARIAFDRLIGEEKTEQKKKWRVVNRKPRGGDYVRIVNPCFTFNKAGDILKVADTVGYDGIHVKGCDHPRGTSDDEHFWCYRRINYEVVEPVTTEQIKKPQYYNGKVVCVECGDDSYTVGKVYEFKDGTLVDDQGDVRYKGSLRVKHLSEIVCFYKFIPFVE